MGTEKIKITIRTIVDVPVEFAWKTWTDPADVVNWNAANEDWHSPSAQNDLRAGGSFCYRMEAKDGSFGFDFGGIYYTVEPLREIGFSMSDGRKVDTTFTDLGGRTEIIETFDAEDLNSVELQRQGWQSILDNYKKYTESKFSKV
jgi:uncharacterized protein YndB with AHSA1/START domain